MSRFQFILSILLLFVLSTARAEAQNIATDPAVTGALKREAFEPGGRFFPSGLSVRGSVIPETRSGHVNIIAGHIIQIAPQLAIQQGAIEGQINYTVGLSGTHLSSQHSPFDSTASSQSTINDSNQTRSVNFNVNVNATLNHPANGYDGPQGNGFPTPSRHGAIDIYSMKIQGQIQGVFRLGSGTSNDQAPLSPGRPGYNQNNPPPYPQNKDRPNSVVFLPEQEQPLFPGDTSNASLTSSNGGFNGFENDNSPLFANSDSPAFSNPPDIYADLTPLEKFLGTNETIKDISQNSVYKWVERNGDSLQDFIVDLTPGVGTAKGVQEAITGENYITGETLSNTERVLAGVGAVPIAGAFVKVGGKWVFKGGKWIAETGVFKNTSKWVTNNVKKVFKTGGKASKQTLDTWSKEGRILDPADKGGKLTKAGRGLAKHGQGARPGNQKFPKAKGSPSQINELGQQQLDDILTHPNSKSTPLGRGGTKVTHPDGRGVRFDADGSFSGFVE